MRVGMSAILVLVAFLAVTFLQSHYSENLSPFLYERITATFEEDTASRNAIAAILLNYRMYDTMFEALILLTAIIGMQQFLPRKVDIEGGDKALEEASPDEE